MKEKIKSMGEWLKEKVKSKNKQTLEGLYELIHQEFYYDRMCIEAANIKVERQFGENLELAKKLSLKEEKINELIKKLDNLQVHFDKLVKITESSNKEFAEGLKKVLEGKWLVKDLPEGKTATSQKMKIKSSTKTSRIMKELNK